MVGEGGGKGRKWTWRFATESCSATCDTRADGWHEFLSRLQRQNRLCSGFQGEDPKTNNSSMPKAMESDALSMCRDRLNWVVRGWVKENQSAAFRVCCFWGSEICDQKVLSRQIDKEPSRLWADRTKEKHVAACQVLVGESSLKQQCCTAPPPLPHHGLCHRPVERAIANNVCWKALKEAAELKSVQRL